MGASQSVQGSRGFEDAVRILMPALKSYAMGMPRSSDQADDLVQETLERAWKNRLRFLEGASFKGWLLSIMRNAAIDEWRRSRFIVDDPDGIHAERLTTSATQAIRVDYTDMLEALAQLPSVMREALLLTALGATQEEAAIVVGCPLGTLKSRVLRGRARLLEAQGAQCISYSHGSLA